MSPRYKNLPSLRHWSALAALVLAAGRAAANPAGMTVAAGTVTAVQNGAQLNLTASQNAVINWQSFNIAANETTTFQQPNNISVVWNRITDQNPSQIFGHLNANGIVVLMNQNGFYFGPNSSVNVGGFVAAGAWATPPASVGGGMWIYQGPPPAASIINYGEIKANNGGSLFMIAEKIENHGILSAPDGTLGLYAGKEVMISERPDGRGLSANVALPDGSINNVGKISADAGTIALHARVVNQDGLIQANSVRDNHGVIELVASDAVNLGADSQIQANGAASGASAGGQITIQSANTFADDPTSQIAVRGGANGGNGGSVEISAANLGEVNSHVDGSAAAGATGGKLLLDPTDLTLNSSSLNPYFGFSQITFTASHNITLAAGSTLDLFASTGVNTPGSQFTLEAGNNIIFGNAAQILGGTGWSVSLFAGVDFNLSTPASIVTTPGTGGIYLNGGLPTAGSENGGTPSINQSGDIEVFDGSITLNAGHEVIVGSGYVRTVCGGNIAITSGNGNVLAGTDNNTYQFTSTGYDISYLGLGGIGTAAGGNVNISAGANIISLKANIGAFGAAPGNVSLTAGGTIEGRFMLRNGTGLLNAGVDVGTSGSPAWFGLVSGGWTANAAGNIYVDEVYNPNGALNSQFMAVPVGSYLGNLDSAGNTVTPPATSQYLFDYSPTAYATFNAGNSVQLLDKSPISTASTGKTPVFAPILDISAGAGGVVLGNNIILYPSASGSLDITTTGGGSFSSTSGGYFQLIESDNGLPGRTALLNGGHAVQPIHLGELGNGVNLDISGDIQNLELILAQAADIHVHGNTFNLALNAQNMAASDVTKLTIDGNFTTRDDLDSVTLANAANFDAIFSGNLVTLADGTIVTATTAGQALGAGLRYDSTTCSLTFKGIMTADELNFLLNPVVYVYDPITAATKIDASGNPVTLPLPFTTDTANLQSLYTESQAIPSASFLAKAAVGLQLGGPGQFQISAQNMDLGTTAGIRSVGPLNNNALAAASVEGAAISLTLAGDLNMSSSQIASFNGGGITINAGGTVNVGSQESFSTDDTPQGIYTAHGGAVSVHAVGDINVDGSRIASYDGGDVTVISDTGTVNAGSGAKGFFYVTTSQLDPTTGKLVNKNDRFFGSGIMALTAPDPNSQTSIGDITVKAGKDILAGDGGILQISFNNINQDTRELTLSAGRDIVADQSGILGINVNLKAGRKLIGTIVANRDLNLIGPVIQITSISGGQTHVTGDAGESKIVGPTVTVDNPNGGTDPNVISTGGGPSGSGGGNAFAGVAAPTAQKTTDAADKTVAANPDQTSDDDELKKRGGGKSPVLAQKVSRVTVILPKKS